MLEPWTFLDVADRLGTNLFKGWLHSLSVNERAAVNNFLIFCQGVERLSRPRAAILKGGDCDGLLELRVAAPSNIEIRILSCYQPKRTVILLCGATKKNDRLIPPGACATAKERKRLLALGRLRGIEHEP